MREITEADLGKRPCMVTAHPDDETLWAGGLLARFRYLNWRVICCSTPRLDPGRGVQFYEACAALGVVVPWCNDVTESPPGIDLRGLDFLVDHLAGFDCVVTHGGGGEYGHNQHIQVNQSVYKAFPGRVLGFGWHRGGAGNLELHLTTDEALMKKRALDCYGPKADALRKRYYGELGVPEAWESYDIYRP